MGQRPPDLDAAGRPIGVSVRPPDLDAQGAPLPARTEGRPQGLSTIADMVALQRNPAFSRGASDPFVGVAKGAGNTAFGLGKVVHDYTPIGRISDAIHPDAFEQRPEAIVPSNEAQRLGYTLEQMGEFFAPTGAAGKVARVAEAIKSAALTGVQGGSKADVAAAGVLAAVPGGTVATKAADALSAKAEQFVRAAVKPTVASLRRITGQGGMDAKANALVRFILDNKLTSPDKARAVFQSAEHELQRVLSVKNAPTDAATRAGRYLDALERSAAKQGLGGDDVKLIRQAANELMAGPMGETVGVDAAGNAIRALRSEVPAKEALESARASSRWTTRKSWGEQKGATTEAAKAVERGQRDAVKAAIPEAKPLLQTQGMAIQSEQALDRMGQRAANRDVVSLPAHVMAAGGQPVLAVAANLLRNNQLRVGIWADSLAKAVRSGNAPLTADILKKIGIASVPALTTAER